MYRDLVVKVDELTKELRNELISMGVVDHGMKALSIIRKVTIYPFVPTLSFQSFYDQS